MEVSVVVSRCKPLFKYWRNLRYKYCLNLLDASAGTLLDIGCSDGLFVNLAEKRGYEALGIDEEENVEVTKREADIVTCFQVLEHVENPIKAIENLKKLYHKQLIISVPNEPIFSLLRLGWDPQHLWAINPLVFKKYLGEPVLEKRIIMNRYYVAVWDRD